MCNAQYFELGVTGMTQKIKILLDVTCVYGELMQRKIYALDCASVGARDE
jgi:hypothetical protein